MVTDIIEIIKDLSEIILAIVNTVCIIIELKHSIKESEKSDNSDKGKR